MSESNSSAQSGGIGFCGLLAILFIALKLLGFIHWSWWWVLAPVWIPPLIVLAILAVVGVGFLIAAFVGANRKRARRRA